MDEKRYSEQRSGLEVRAVVGGYELILDGTLGVDGSLFCRNLTVAIEPGSPPDSIYKKVEDR